MSGKSPLHHFIDPDDPNAHVHCLPADYIREVPGRGTIRYDTATGNLVIEGDPEFVEVALPAAEEVIAEEGERRAADFERRLLEGDDTAERHTL